ncbi:YCF48-related protein [Candidatus Uhrbacteria bacterium]|nr:YCF48-related protein [Candidatus Uhrbacteria bacterium]
MKNLTLRLAFPLFALVLFGQGCFGGTATGPTGPDGGVWKTVDGGVTWANKRALVQGPKVTADAASLSVLAMAMDPQDPSAIYLGTDGDGLVYSLDAGDSWQKSAGYGTGRVSAIAVDPKNKCTVYAATANRIYKTETCGRDWATVFVDPRTDKSFTQLIVDWFNPTILYAGTSEGDIFKSVNAGASWQASTRVEGTPISTIVMDPRDSRIVYVGTQGDGIWLTKDGGNTWSQVKKQFGDEFRDARRVTQVVLDPKTPDMLYVVSKYGIIVSQDQGETWKALNLTAPPGTITILAMAVDPTDSAKLVYTSPTTITFSQDGGATWTSKKLPTTQQGAVLLMDPKDGNVIYLGTRPQKKN